MSNASLTQFQIGIETTPGTAVAATRVLYFDGDLPELATETEPVEQARNSYNQYADINRMSKGGTWKGESQANYYDWPLFMNLALAGGVTPTGAGPYLWEVDSENVGALDTATLEAGDDVAAVRMPYAITKSWEISGADGNGPKPVMFKLDMLGKTVEANALTAALPALDLRGEYIPFTRTAIYVDDTAGGIGTTEWQESLMAFHIKGDNKISPLFPGGSGGEMTAHGRGKRYVEMMGDLLLTADQWSEWQNKFVGDAVRFVQFKWTLSASRDAYFNIATRFESAVWNRSNGSRRVRFIGKSIYDPDLGYAWKNGVTNGLAAL